MNRVSFSPRALVDYEAAVRWYQRQHPELGRRFRQAVTDCMKKVVAVPRLMPLSTAGTRRVYLHRFPYAIYYVESAHGLNVVAIMHGRRHPDSWASGFGENLRDDD